VLQPSQVADFQLKSSMAVMVNCPGVMPDAGVKRIERFVRAGGLLYTTDWALKSGLGPDNRIAQEPVADNPYRNFIAVKSGNENEAWVKTLVASYQI